MRKISALLVFAGAAVAALAVDPRLAAITPPGVQRGTEVEVRFNGNRLDDTQEILWHSPGISVVKLVETKPDHVTAKLKVAADCQLGEHVLRLRTATGISTLRTLFVSPFPNVEENEPNNEVAKAQKIPMNVTVNGTVRNEDLDFYAIEAKKGQRISAEVEGMRLGRAMFDPYVSLRDKDGNILAKSDDTAFVAQDCFVSMLAPADGTYVVEVRETSYGGGGDPYRLHVGDFPRPSAVYPAGGKAGETLKVKFIGDPAGEFTQEVRLPAVLPDDNKYGVIAVQNGVSAPSANVMRVVDFPNVLEAEPNDDVKQATATTMPLPLAFNGIIEKDGDVDWFRFKAAKGQALDINVHARHIRSPLDSVLTIANADGGTIASNDDSGGPDSYVRFTVPKDGEFAVKVTDHAGKGGPDYVYRVEIKPVTPSLSIYVADTARNDTQTRKSIVVARGNRFAQLFTTRRKDFSGDLVFNAESLPAGVTMATDTMPAGQTVWPVVFEAKPDAPVAGKLTDITAQTVSPQNGKDIKGGIWQNYELILINNVGTFYQTYADKIAVAVAEELPFKVRIVEPKAALVRYGSMNLKVVAERKPGFDGPIELKMLWNPPGIGSLPDVTIPKGATSADYQVNANGNADLRAWKIAVLANATVKEGTAYTSSQLAELKVAEPFLFGKIDMASIVRGSPVKVTCKLDQKIPFNGKATIQLLGLPAGATTSEKQITKADKEVTFDVATTPTATKGRHTSLFCSVTIQQNGETITQTIGSGGTLRIDAPKTAVAEAKPSGPQVAMGKQGKRLKEKQAK